MPLILVKSDITKMNVDAIINPANPTLLGGGGLDGEIHDAAGAELLEECRTLGGCATGEAKITRGYNLPAKYIIHTVGPIWQGGTNGERELLFKCYHNSLFLAAKHNCNTVAVPVISAGAYGYPVGEATEIAKRAILCFIEAHDDITVYLVMRERLMPEKGRLYSQIEYYMMQNGISATDALPDRVFVKADDTPCECRIRDPRPAPNACFAESETDSCSERRGIPKPVQKQSSPSPSKKASTKRNVLPHFGEIFSGRKADKAPAAKNSLEDMLDNLDMGFSETLLRLIDASGMTDAQCYKRANIDRKLFSKIRSNKEYKPSKSTVLAFAIALRLNLDDTRMLLERAGYALSPSSKFDVIIQFFITNGNYDIYEINDALFAFDQSLLGA